MSFIRTNIERLPQLTQRKIRKKFAFIRLISKNEYKTYFYSIESPLYLYLFFCQIQVVTYLSGLRVSKQCYTLQRGSSVLTKNNLFYIVNIFHGKFPNTSSLPLFRYKTIRRKTSSFVESTVNYYRTYPNFLTQFVRLVFLTFKPLEKVGKLRI